VTISALLVAFAGTTLWALESDGVATITTHAPDGETRSTHVWFVDFDGELWLEAGTPENPWFTDMKRDPRIRFSAAGRSDDYLAEPVAGSETHTRLRQWLRDKYGLRDRWVGLLVDTSHSVAVRLHPAQPGSDSPP